MKTFSVTSFTKRTNLLIYLSFILGAFFFSCQKDDVVLNDSNTFPAPNLIKLGNSCYDVTLIGGAPVNNGDGTYTWTWSVVNTTPGNGKNNGTCKNLSHWNFLPSTCLDNDDIVSAAYAYGNDPYTTISPTPVMAVDPSQQCSNGVVVFKFDFGTSGSQPTYYQLTVNQNYAVDHNAIAFWKAGTSCGSGTFQGIGCFENQGNCSDETAFGGNTAGPSGPHIGAWFYYFNTNGPATQSIYSGQHWTDGTVTWNGSEYTINLGSNLTLDPTATESVKVWGYAVPPSSRPNAGNCPSCSPPYYKGTSLVVPGNGFSYHVIHLDVIECN